MEQNMAYAKAVVSLIKSMHESGDCSQILASLVHTQFCSMSEAGDTKKKNIDVSCRASSQLSCGQSGVTAAANFFGLSFGVVYTLLLEQNLLAHQSLE